MLTDKQCKNATCPPDKKRARFTDSLGLYLEVSPTGSKRWFWKTYFDGKEGRMALGSYPAQSLADARMILPPYSSPRPSRNKPPGPLMAPAALVRPAAS